MEMVRVAGFTVAAAFGAAVLRRMRPEAGMAMALAAGVMLLTAVLGRMEGIAQAMQRLCSQAKLQPTYIRTMFKTVGICFLTDAASTVCRDVEENGLAVRVETVGRVLVMAVAAPVLVSLLEQLMELTV